MNKPDKNTIALLIGKKEPSILKEYLDLIANKALLAYRNHLQWGNKEGESLYIHILNGILILETLHIPLKLTAQETRILMVAYTVHDINKVVEDSKQSFNKIANEANISAEIVRLGLDAFCPNWLDYLEDIVGLVRSHGGATQTSGELLMPKYAPQYRLGHERIIALRYLMKAVDVLDLSHTLDEKTHKQTFLGHLNAFLAEAQLGWQYSFFTHQLSEARGILSNVLHEVIIQFLQKNHGVVPLLYYPDGVVYLADRSRPVSITTADKVAMGQEVANVMSDIVRGKFRSFIEPRPAGIKVDAKCLELGVPFAGESSIWREIYNQVQRRNLNHQTIEEKARERTGRDLAKNQTLYPDAALFVQTLLDNPEPFITPQDKLLRFGEMVRTYYIFLSDHCKLQIPQPWEHIYQLLELPPEKWAYYAFFEARYDRAYVLASDITQTEEELYQRIAQDGQAILGGETEEDSSKSMLFTTYVERFVIFSSDTTTKSSFTDHLKQYVTSQHKQCVQCGSLFSTKPWMAGDVREDITVQVFSNRLRGGPGEPKKQICAICQQQFLLEKLNYPDVRGEKLLYFHLFPYSFMTGPYVDGLRHTFSSLVEGDVAVQALNMEAIEAVKKIETAAYLPQFRYQTQKGTPQPYGVYIPRYSQTIGNMLVFPINPAGDNDTERFLFALWNALVLQRHFGFKVLLSSSPIPPLAKENFGDLFIDNIPLAVQGLLPDNNYYQFKPQAGQELGNLPTLYQKIEALFRLRDLTFISEDTLPRLIRALTVHPLQIFFETDRLLELKTQKNKTSGGLETWAYQEAFTPVTLLAKLLGGKFMKKLSDELQELARLAWHEKLRGSSLERSSLLFAFDELFKKTSHLQNNQIIDKQTLKAAATQDIFDHLERLAKREGFTIGKTRFEACEKFVNIWFNDILQIIYEGNLRRLLGDEKMLRSAFLFYIRQEIKTKEDK